MKAPAPEQRKLLDLKAADDRVAQLQHSLRTLPQEARLAELQRDSAAARKEYAGVMGELDDAKTEIARVEGDIHTVAAREKRDNERLQATASTKDIQGLERELESLRVRRLTLEDTELEVMERVEEIEHRLAAITARRDDIATEERLLAASRDEQKQRITTQLEIAVSERSAIADGIVPELLALYDKLRARYGVGAALLQRRVSLGSNVELTGTDLAVIRAAAEDDVVLDPESTCILVRTEESGL
ncbi:zinc ribbon domain-containing protein [Herbiconiux liangxiaofengii]|uniref:zinc ribbon domain-containing protein n=1 Tax=Herbiconiux liangxiaofengii TaxID=3342795 RepID=UPI0035BB8C88